MQENTDNVSSFWKSLDDVKIDDLAVVQSAVTSSMFSILFINFIYYNLYYLYNLLIMFVLISIYSRTNCF